MNKQDIALLLAYDRWATDRQLSIVSGLSEEQYTRDLHSSHGGIQGTLVHTFGAQEVWLERWKGRIPGPYAGPKEVRTPGVLVERWNALRLEIEDFFRPLTDAGLEEIIHYRTLAGDPSAEPLWQLMQHVANHSTYHRGQVTTMLRQLGVVPVATDLIVFYRTLPKASLP